MTVGEQVNNSCSPINTRSVNIKSCALSITDINSVYLTVKRIIMVVTEVNTLYIAFFAHSIKFSAVDLWVGRRFFHKRFLVYPILFEHKVFALVSSESSYRAMLCEINLFEQVKDLAHRNMLNNNARHNLAEFLLIAVTNCSIPINLIFVHTVITNFEIAVTVDCIKQELNFIAVLNLEAMIADSVNTVITFTDKSLKGFVNLKLFLVCKSNLSVVIAETYCKRNFAFYNRLNKN